MKRFKQFTNESEQYTKTITPSFRNGLIPRPHYGAFGTGSDSDFDVKLRNPDEFDTPRDMRYHTLVPAVRLGNESPAESHTETILHSAPLPRQTATPSGKHVTYVPMKGPALDVRAHHDGYSSLHDLVTHHLHPMASKHLDRMAEGTPMTHLDQSGSSSGASYQGSRGILGNHSDEFDDTSMHTHSTPHSDGGYMSEPGLEEHPTVHVMALHHDYDAMEPHEDGPHKRRVKIAPRGWWPKVSTSFWSPVTGHENTGGFDEKPGDLVPYGHNVVFHNVDVLSKKAKKSTRSVVSGILRKRKVAAKA